MISRYLFRACQVSIVSLFFATISTSAGAEHDPATNKGRRLSIGPSAMVLLERDALKEHGQHAYGVQSLYEFVQTPRFSLGLDLTYRLFTGGAKRASQLRYGLIMKHDLAEMTFATQAWRPYIAYGLLLQVLRREGMRGDGTAHDTKLAMGMSVVNGWWLEAAYHISRLRYFNTNAVRLDYIEANGGYMWSW